MLKTILCKFLTQNIWQSHINFISLHRILKHITMSYKGRDLGQDFKDFFKREKRRITRNLKELGCSNFKFDYGFYYFYGFFTSKSGQIYYLSCSDVRHWGYNQLLYRTAKHYKDWTGGGNQYIDTNKLKEMKLI